MYSDAPLVLLVSIVMVFTIWTVEYEYDTSSVMSEVFISSMALTDKLNKKRR